MDSNDTAREASATTSVNLDPRYFVVGGTLLVTYLLWSNLILSVFFAGIALAVYSAKAAHDAESKEERTLASFPPSIQLGLANLDEAALNAFYLEYDKKRKKAWVAHIVGFFPGWHYIYLKQYGKQFAFWFTGGGFGIWWFVDQFRMGRLVRGVNETVAREVLQTLAMAGHSMGAPNFKAA